MILNNDDIKIEVDPKYLSFFNFYKEAFSILNPTTPFIDNWHLRKMCSILERETYRIALNLPKTKDIIFNVPFRTGKSELSSICWNAWSWIIYPSMSFLTISYSASLSNDHSRKTRNLIESDWYQQNFGHIYSLSSDQKAKSHIETSAKGARYATSTKGSGTGMGGDVILFDDPMNPKESESEKERTNANKAYKETFYSRTRNPETAVRVIIMQRLHELDTTGYILSTSPKSFNHYVIPAELAKQLKPNSWSKYYNDGLFWDKRFTRAVLDDYKITLGSYSYAGQLSQLPSPEKGSLWQRDWFISQKIESFPINMLTDIGTDWDTAYTSKEANAANAYVSSAKHVGTGIIYILDVGYFWSETPELVKRMKTKQEPHYVEGKASGKSAVQFLKKDFINAIEIQVDGGDKIQRTRLVTPTVESGRVVIAEHILDMLLNDDKQGILSFPNNSHKDLNDAFVQALQRHSSSLTISQRGLESLTDQIYEQGVMI